MQRRNFLRAGALALVLPLANAAKPKATGKGKSIAITVYKSPTCGCCAHWIEHLRQEGFEPKVIDTQDMNSVKLSQHVPETMMSCHTAVVGNYFIEGHVPAKDIKQLLKEQPKALGLAVPGMPMGSPGMEMAGHSDAYSVHLVKADGATEIYSRY